MTEETATIVDGVGENVEVPAPAPISLVFGSKVVLRDADHQSAILERIKEHETAIAKAEVELFECKFLNQNTFDIVSRIQNSYSIVEALVNQHNIMYGGDDGE